MENISSHLDIKLNKKELIDLFYFNEDNEGINEKAEAEKYLDLKGVMNYINMINFLIDKNVDVWHGNKIKYRVVSDFFHYDKRLRLILYRYIGALEEYFRATIISNNIDFLTLMKKKYKKRYIELIKKVTDFLNKNPFDQLLEFTFRDTINLIIDNKKEFKNFTNIQCAKIAEKLNAIVDLRNKVNHFKIILMCSDFRISQDVENKSALENNLINLKQLLPECFWKDFTQEINNALDDMTSKKELKNIKMNISE